VPVGAVCDRASAFAEKRAVIDRAYRITLVSLHTHWSRMRWRKPQIYIKSSVR